MQEILDEKDGEIARKAAELSRLKKQETEQQNEIHKRKKDIEELMEEKQDMAQDMDKMVIEGERKIETLKAKHQKADKMYRDIELLRKKIDRKASKAVGKIIAGYTVADLLEMVDMDKKAYDRLGYNKSILLDELEDHDVIDREKMQRDYIAKHLSEEDKELQTLIAEHDRLLQGEGKIAKGAKSRSNFAEGVSNVQLDAAMKDYPQYLGTAAADEMLTLLPQLNNGEPVISPKQVCWILNTDPRGKPGMHWVAFYIDARPDGSHSVEYYDPLAQPMPSGWMDQLKVFVREIHGQESYLKFRENRITDQKDSSNCGPFCVRFLQARLKGATFARASGWDKAGEKNIEIWKKLPKQRMWISSQRGEGLRDIYETVRKGATRVMDRIKQTIGAAENGVTRASPSVRGWLSSDAGSGVANGDLPISSITVCKKPIYSMIETIGNWLSLGKLKENMDRLGYDRLMHLYMIVSLEGGPTVKIEKNHVVEIKPSSDLGKANLKVSGPFTTVGDMLGKAEKKHGNKLWQYDAKTQNCQYFVLWFLAGLVTPEIKGFVQQDIEKSLDGMGLLEKAARIVTDVTAVVDVAQNGAGKQDRKEA
jgi:hypothetical protein